MYNGLFYADIIEYVFYLFPEGNKCGEKRVFLICQLNNITHFN